jgi:hypothetical protein
MRVYPFFLGVLVCLPAFGQHDMQGMNMPGMDMNRMSPAENFLMNLASGTAVNPSAWPMPMTSQTAAGWTFNFMAQAFLNDTQQTGPRGADKLYSTNWLMATGQHRLGHRGAIRFDGMFSLEPATITDRRYPLLFQTGETAFGKPIVDGQHPHDFFMALGLTYAYQISESATIELAFHPVGDPALGPVAYPHRASAAEIPQAPISHHLQDSTHIADDVLTAGIAYRKFKLEASGFHGGEPDEFRWNIDQGKMDSWSGRLWYLPSKNWAAQVSTGHLTHPEALEAGDQERTTASLAYSKPLPGGSWSSTVVWGRNHYTATKQNINSYLAETVVPFHRLNFLTGRVELADKNELLGINANSSYRIGAYTAGYTRDFPLFARLETGLGANVTFYSLPDAIKPEYGNRPMSANVFLRLRLRPAQR